MRVSLKDARRERIPKNRLVCVRVLLAENCMCVRSGEEARDPQTQPASVAERLPVTRRHSRAHPRLLAGARVLQLQCACLRAAIPRSVRTHEHACARVNAVVLFVLHSCSQPLHICLPAYSHPLMPCLRCLSLLPSVLFPISEIHAMPPRHASLKISNELCTYPFCHRCT